MWLSKATENVKRSHKGIKITSNSSAHRGDAENEKYLFARCTFAANYYNIVLNPLKLLLK